MKCSLRSLSLYLVLLVLSLTLSSCGGGEHSATDTGSASFGLTLEEASAPAMKLAPSAAPADICSSYGIDSISGTVYNSSNSVIATGGPWACSAHTGTIYNIPPGSNLRITITGIVSGTVVWQGETTGKTIYSGQDTNVGSIMMTYTGNDTTRPAVSAATPTGSNVPLTSPITVTFSEAMVSSTIDTTTFTLKNGSVAVPGSVSYNATTKAATFTPTSSLSNSTAYTATVTTDVTDMAANKMQSLYTWNFTTEAPPGSAPSVPTGVGATAADKQVTISWSAVTGATSYNIYWSTTSGVTKTSGTKITGATSPYTHTGLTNGTIYYYVVTAVNSYGESGASSQVNTAPSSGAVSDTTAPSNTTSTNFINSGASSATSTSVTLALSATDAVGVTAYYASETSTTPSASAGGWTAITSTTSYSASVSFPLSSGDGTKTVYIWFKDAAGNVSAVASDSISLTVSGSSADTTPPVLTSVTVTPATITGSGTVTIKLGLTESGSGVSSNCYAYLYSPTRLSSGTGTSLYVSLTYNSTSGLYEGTANIQNYHESGVWQVGVINTSDLAGNNRYYNISSSVSTVNYAYSTGTGSVDSGVAIQGVTKY